MIKSDKNFLSLIIEIIFEAITNRILNYNFIELYTKYEYEYFEKNCKII